MRSNSSNIDESSNTLLDGKGNGYSDVEICGHVNTVTRLRIANLCCAGEERIIRTVIGKLSGVQELSINVIGKYIVVKHCQMVCCSPATLIREKLNNKRLGASIQEVGEDCSEEEASDLRLDVLQLLFVLAIVAMFVVALSLELCEVNDLAAQIAYVACIWLGVAPVLYAAYIALLRRTVDINILILVAIGGAVSVFEFSDAALVVVLYNFSRFVECEVLRWVRKTASAARGSIPKVAMLPSGCITFFICGCISEA
jgi:Zn2+/Cd2+-exporting ATPase